MSESDYAKDVLVSADWVEEHLDGFQNDDLNYRLVDVDVDTEAYDEAHAPGAIGFNWGTQLTGSGSTRHPHEERFRGSDGKPRYQ